MEGWRDDCVAGGGRRWRRRGGGEESDGSGGVELSLRLRTGDSSGAPPAAAAAAAMVVAEEEAQAAAAAEARRSMTIFYDGRVCAVDVTEVQARAIISMANEEMILAAADHRRQQCHLQLQDSGSSSSSTSSIALARDAHVRPPPAAAAAAAGSSRQGFAGAPVMDQAAASRLSMKRSLQSFLQKRKDRTAGAVAPPYAGGRHAQAVRR